jgi:hypothetical protein
MTASVFSKEEEVVPLLTKMRLPRWVMIELATKIAGERANVSPVEPRTVRGWETWRWGTRYFREEKELLNLEWEICDKHQIPGIRNKALGIKLVFCNTDVNTASLSRQPKNIAERGNAARYLIKKNSGQIEMDFIQDDDDDELWLYCLHCSENDLTIEISRPDAEAGGIITHFSHRIIIASKGEIPGIRRALIPDNDFAEVKKPKLIRK